MKKNALIGFFIFLMLLLPSVTASTYISERKTNVDVIYNNLEEKIAIAESKNDVKLCYKEALIELENNGLLGKYKANDVYNLMFEDDNAVTVQGKSTETRFLERPGVHFYKLSQQYDGWLGLFFDYMWRLYFRENLEAFIHTDSWIVFGTLYVIRLYVYDKWPAEGYVKIVDSGGEIEYTTPFYGHLGFITHYNIDDPGAYWYYCIGIKGFKGLRIGDYYFGTAQEVDISNNRPNP